MGWRIAQAKYTTKIVGMDERADWLLDDSISDFKVAGNGDLIPFILQIEDEHPSIIVGQLIELSHLYVCNWYLTESEQVKGQTIRYPKPGMPFVAYAALEFFQLLASLSDVHDGVDLPDIEILRKSLKRLELQTPHVRTQPLIAEGNFSDRIQSNSDICQLYSPENQKEKWSDDTVIMAVIDDGIAIANTQFQHKSGTRVEYFWKQDGSISGNTVPNGHELNKQVIDGYLAASKVGGMVDEDNFYRRAGLAFSGATVDHNSLLWRASHGTHVMDIATGYAKESDVKNRPIIAVQLPSPVVENTSGSGLDHHVIDAVNYILQRAKSLSPDRDLPLVINLSFGRYSGSHDGNSVLERYLDAIAATRKNTQIVLPAGNSRQARCHSILRKTDFALPQNKSQLSWRVQPDDRTQSYLDIWMPVESGVNPSTANRVSISIIAPNRDESPQIGEASDQGDLLYEVDGQVVCRVNTSFQGGKIGRSLFTVSMMPTARYDNIEHSGQVRPTAPAGLWKVIVKDLNLTDNTEINCWIERDDTAYGYRPRGRQSYFDDDQYEKYDDTFRPVPLDTTSSSTTKRMGTLNGIATGKETVVVGAMYGKERSATDYTASGPASVVGRATKGGATTGLRNGPDLLTIADDSKVHPGVPGAGTRSGSVVYFNGTSVAAPRVARELANIMAMGGDANRAEIGRIVSAQESLGNGAPPRPDVQLGGNGRWELEHPYSQLDRFEKDKKPVFT